MKRFWARMWLAPVAMSALVVGGPGSASSPVVLLPEWRESRVAFDWSGELYETELYRGYDSSAYQQCPTLRHLFAVRRGRCRLVVPLDGIGLVVDVIPGSVLMYAGDGPIYFEIGVHPPLGMDEFGRSFLRVILDDEPLRITAVELAEVRTPTPEEEASRAHAQRTIARLMNTSPEELPGSKALGWYRSTVALDVRCEDAGHDALSAP